MLLSQLFTKTSKDAAHDAESKNAEFLARAGYVSKTMAGVYSYLPLGLRVLRSIEQVVREEMDRIGSQEVWLSALSPKENWETTGRWDPKVFDVLFHVPGAGDQEYALNPTHEEIITPLMKQYIRSYRDLPFGAYQIQTKFRNELRAKSGILRGREFLMKDLYSFHTDQADLDRYYEVVMGAYDQIFVRLGLAEKTYLTFASGGSFSQYSHEYQVVLEKGEDTIFISIEAEKQGKHIAINKEIFKPGETKCPVTGGTEFREAKASEAANIFKLSNKFSAPFELQYTKEDGSRSDVIMGCYGIGISRLMGILTEACADEAGLRWPSGIAPVDMHIVPLAKTADEESYTVAKALYEKLMKAGKRCLFDDRIDNSVGSRMADADMLGSALRIVVSPKTLKEKKLEVKNRWTAEMALMEEKDFSNLLT
ncbi:MAG: aminoacyl--tRNA ligase-related protein [Candidatus Peribacteraceae bacterium]